MDKKHMIVCAILLAFCGLPLFAVAQAPQAAPPAVSVQAREAWKNMTPEQRQAKRAEMKEKWNALSPEEKAAKRQQAHQHWQKKWENMTPEEQAAAKAKAKERWDGMTPEQQDKAKMRMMKHRKMNHHMKKSAQ